MPPRFAFWTIILDGSPTSFRAREREEILPLFNQLKAKNPDALLKWFSGGQLWDSPEQARDARALEKVKRFREERAREKQARAWSPGSSPRPSSGQAAPGAPKAEDPLAEFRRQHGRPPDGSDDPSTRVGSERSLPSTSLRTGRAGPSLRPRGGRPAATKPWEEDGQPDRGAVGREAGGERRVRPEARGGARPPKVDRRGKDWRPGGDHRDPRDKYALPPGEARKRWKERNLGPRGPHPSGRKRFRPKPGGPRRFDERPEENRPFKPKPFGGKPGAPRKPHVAKPFGGRKTGGQRFGKPPKGPRGPRGRD